ncbi:hypothetical protein SGPA1_11974 [Streptomyces misionensis JCM 4497]
MSLRSSYVEPYGHGGLSGRSRSGHRPGILMRAPCQGTSNTADALSMRNTTIPRIGAHAMADSVTSSRSQCPARGLRGAPSGLLCAS